MDTINTFTFGSTISSSEDSFLILFIHESTLKQMTYEKNIEQILSSKISKSKWNIIEKKYTELPHVVFDGNTTVATILKNNDNLSRYNSTIQSKVVTDNFNNILTLNNSKNVDIVLLIDEEKLFGTITAVIKSFHPYSEKASNGARNVNFCIYKNINNNLVEISLDEYDRCNILINAIQCARVMTETPGNIMGPDYVEEYARKAMNNIKGVTIDVIKGSSLKDKGFGGIYAVGKGSAQDPRLIHIKYKPELETCDKCIAIVGKGITFDTGGYTIKGRTGMPGMKRDCGGAAAALGAFYYLTKIKYPQTIHLLLCVAENAVGPNATKPDDVIKMLSGKTVEVNNTDAEGRLVLGDGVYYAKETLKCGTIIDIATLTGAQSYASGKFHCSFMTSQEECEKPIIDAGKYSGELCHPLIYCPELYMSDLKSKVADMKNANLGSMSSPPSSLAAHFIGAQIEQGKDVKWIHLDIAAPANYQDYSTGFGVSLISSLISKCMLN
uniref:CYTOSOL_AP domain-containing protein n=1 Tax=Parastrongyloides trichosuri TaxID=131310 RepID=A0A0N4Z590_PARTI